MPVGSIIGIPRGISKEGYLKCNGLRFSSSTYPDLYQFLGKNVTPNLNRSDVGMTAFFAVDQIPDGWIAFDSIRTTVTQQSYPELYQYLVNKYGSIAQVPLVEDRFIRNAGNALNVGEKQGDAIRNITGTVETLFYGGSHSGVFTQTPGKNGSAGVASSYGPNSYTFDASTVVPTADENRPKSIVLKLCIKAKNSFDDVVFWIKAFGEVVNAGVLDAGTLAQDLQNKANVNHTHDVSDITNFNHSVTVLANSLIANSFTYQKIGDFEIWKFPNGLMIQTYKWAMPLGRNSPSEGDFFNWAVSFIEKPFVLITAGVTSSNQCDTFTVLRNTSTQSKCVFYVFESYFNNEQKYIDFQAIGRWK